MNPLIVNDTWKLADEHITEYKCIHYNWGYYGYCDGYYNLNVFNTSRAVEYDDPNDVGMNYDYSTNVKYISVY